MQLKPIEPIQMLRSIILSSARSRASIRFSRPLLVSSIRYNSSRTPEERKAHNKAKEELLKDWVAPILTYEEVKRKSQQPSEVRSFCSLVTQSSPHFVRMRI